MNTSASSVRTILVPLDGSALAERALPVAEHLASALDAALLLVRVVPVSTWAVVSPGIVAPAEAFQTHIDEEDKQARAYLERRADELRARGRMVRTFAVRGDPAATILGIEPRARVDLVVMATHGRTGLARFALGSVADAVVRGGVVPGGRAPVLLVRSFGEALATTPVDAVVPLDGSPLAELALDLARQLGGPVLRRITLVRVVDLDGPAVRADEAAHYLESTRRRLAAELRERSCAVSSAILTGKPAEEIARYVERTNNVLIMATRGQTGPLRWALGSMADQVLQGTNVPLLLVRPSHAAEQPPQAGTPAPVERDRPPVLVVVEDPAFRQSVALALSESGYAATEAATEDEATALLRRGGHRMVILLDRHRLGVLTAAANDRRLAGRHVYVLICADDDSLDAYHDPAFNTLTLLVLRRPFDVSKLFETVAAAACRLPRANAAISRTV